MLVNVSLEQIRVNLLRWSLKQFLQDRNNFSVCRCKFTPMEFETCSARTPFLRALPCKFTPMEFETALDAAFVQLGQGVNLLRWSLKLHTLLLYIKSRQSVNLLRWSLKPVFPVILKDGSIECKFTPMEFETIFAKPLKFLKPPV